MHHDCFSPASTMTSPIWRAIALSVVLLVASQTSQLATAADEANTVHYNQDVRPILSKHCFACHGFDENNREADLRLDVFEDATADRGDYAAIVPGKPDASEVWNRIVSTDPDEVMPPADGHAPLSDDEKHILRQWIVQGAEYEGHWAFVAPEKPPVPQLFDRDGVTPAQPQNPIDAFIQRRLQAEELQPAPLADKQTIIRRVTLDLTGLPPTQAEVERFLEDKSENAYERLVDDLQNRITYGEHMARPWLDLARYADTHGLHLDNERSMWPYRDWVVQAMHENLPFDEFTRWQLAGDLLPEPTREQLVASGFNRCNVTTGEGGSIQKEWIFRYAVERTSATAEVWMGLTAGCAVCHDHKFDPLSAKEFYSLYAFFHSAADPAMDGNRIDTPPILKLPTEDQEKEKAHLTKQIDHAEQQIVAAVNEHDYAEPSDEDALDDPKQSFAHWTQLDEKERAKGLPGEIQKSIKDRSAADWTDEERLKVQRAWLRHISTVLTSKLEPLKKAKQDFVKKRDELEKSIPLTFVMADLKKPRESFVMLRGAYDKPGEKVTRNVPAFLPSLDDKPEGDYNRLDLANWLLSRQHPLTARVTVNRFWQQFFGVGLVETAEDFGTQGQLPTHPELLDWLAVQFMDDGWDMRRLVRRIVTSHAYRQSSKASSELTQRDPGNRLYARGPRIRLDAEVIRDQALFVSGLLVPKVGGKGVNPYQPPNIWEPVGFGGSNTRNYKQGKGDQLYRRSLYTFLKRTAPPPFMSTFDAPNREQVCSRRGRSNTPMQALQLMNDIQHVEAARAFAERIIQEGGSTSRDRIRWAWRSLTARWPDSEELSVVQQTLEAHQKRFEANPKAARELVSYGQSKPNETIAPEKLASYTMIANLILNLDEVVSKN